MNKQMADNISDLATRGGFADGVCGLPYPHDALLHRVCYSTGLVALVRWSRRLYRVNKLNKRNATIYSFPPADEYKKNFTRVEIQKLMGRGSWEKIEPDEDELDKLMAGTFTGTLAGCREQTRDMLSIPVYSTKGTTKSELKVEWMNFNTVVKYKTADVLSAQQKGISTMKLFAVTIVEMPKATDTGVVLGVRKVIIPTALVVASGDSGRLIRDAAIMEHSEIISEAGGLEKVAVLVHGISESTY